MCQRVCQALVCLFLLSLIVGGCSAVVKGWSNSDCDPTPRSSCPRWTGYRTSAPRPPTRAPTPMPPPPTPIPTPAPPPPTPVPTPDPPPPTLVPTPLPSLPAPQTSLVPIAAVNPATDNDAKWLLVGLLVTSVVILVFIVSLTVWCCFSRKPPCDDQGPMLTLGVPLVGALCVACGQPGTASLLPCTHHVCRTHAIRLQTLQIADCPGCQQRFTCII